MFAAAEGKSKIGIPNAVGAKFAAADRARGPKKLPMSAPKGVVAKRAANNNSKTPRLGLQNKVTDSDPMGKGFDPD